METSDPPSPNKTLEERVVSLEKGVRLFAVTILLLSSIPGFVLALTIKPYAAAFSAVANLTTLSPVFTFVLNYPLYFIIMAVLLPLAGIIITAKAKDPFRAMLAACVYLLIVLVQFSVTWLAFAASAKALFVSSSRI
jgi:hypothetical protein